MSVDDETEFMEEDNDRGGEEGEGMDQHKSVIVHLIKQVRIGMDLTKGKSGINGPFITRHTQSFTVILMPIKTQVKLGAEFSLFCHMVIS